MPFWDRSYSSRRSDASMEEKRAALLSHKSWIHGEASISFTEEQNYVQRRIAQNPMWTVDRGTGWYSQERLAKKKASLLGSGRDEGKSKVKYQGIAWTHMLKHVWKRDFFTTVVHMRFLGVIAAMMTLYFFTFFSWAVVYYVTWKVDNTCFIGFDGFRSAFLFSIETQQTIGYGTHAIGDCWVPALLVGAHCIVAVLLEAIFIGILFAKISHPKGRSRTILISECACIARRDGILKFMFRVADIRKRTVLVPRLRAVLYTWGEGHITREGEQLPVTVQDLDLHYYDHTLLLPVVVEHTVDERSPLYGHTYQTLEALGAEVVVTLEGVNELGDTFMTRRSYLPSEIHWGCVFVPIMRHAEPGKVQHTVDLSRFHEVEPQPSLPLVPPQRISQAVVMGGVKRVPRPLLRENTLCVSDDLVVCCRDGRWYLMARIGDSYPSQMMSVNARMFIYRYGDQTSAEGEALPYTMAELPLVTRELILRYPVTVMHELTSGTSPLAHWVTSDGVLQDADAEIALVVSATLYASSHLASRSRVYPVLGRVKWGWAFAPCVVPPNQSGTGCTKVDWKAFHSLVPIDEEAKKRAQKQLQLQQQQGVAGPVRHWLQEVQPQPLQPQQQQQGWVSDGAGGPPLGPGGQQQQQGEVEEEGGTPQVWWAHTMGRVAEVQALTDPLAQSHSTSTCVSRQSEAGCSSLPQPGPGPSSPTSTAAVAGSAGTGREGLRRSSGGEQQQQQQQQRQSLRGGLRQALSGGGSGLVSRQSSTGGLTQQQDYQGAYWVEEEDRSLATFRRAPSNSWHQTRVLSAILPMMQEEMLAQAAAAEEQQQQQDDPAEV